MTATVNPGRLSLHTLCPASGLIGFLWLRSFPIAIPPLFVQSATDDLSPARVSHIKILMGTASGSDRQQAYLVRVKAAECQHTDIARPKRTSLPMSVVLFTCQQSPVI